MSKNKLTGHPDKCTINVSRAREIIDKALGNGFHQATREQLMREARSIRHLRSLIGYHQRLEKKDKRDVTNDAPYVAKF